MSLKPTVKKIIITAITIFIIACCAIWYVFTVKFTDTVKEKADFAVFVSSLYARSPAMVTAYAELTGYLAQHITNVTLKDRSRFEKIMDQIDAEKGKTSNQKQRDEAFEFMRDKSRYVLHVDRKRGLPALGVADRLTDLFLEMTWMMCESRNQHLIASDNPVDRKSVV